jgi:iron(II)-dependent oxidoreductase
MTKRTRRSNVRKRHRQKQALGVCFAVLVAGAVATRCAAQAQTRPEIDWVRIPGGPARMGSTAEEIEAAYQEARLRSSLLERYTFELEAPAHEVELTPFDISRYEITNTQYRAFVEATGHAQPHGLNDEPIWGHEGFDGDDNPVVGVSWWDARAFAGWVDAELPTEAQWERAARGVERRKFPWGDRSPTPGHANFARRLNHTAPVGSYERGATPNGVHDMGGNVWEWCRDEDDPRYYANSPRRDPLNLPDPSSPADRVIRGGSWDQGVAFMRSALRFKFHPRATHKTIGFRIARAAEAP